MPNADRYRERAADALQKSLRAGDPHARAFHLAHAKTLYALAPESQGIAQLVRDMRAEDARALPSALRLA